ncbi:MAG TPA: hypothetical protein VF773_10605 [Verrucomicrobiae bacterium]
MSSNPNSANPAQPTTPETDALQFDRAEFTSASALQCSFCKAPVSGQFFQVNGQTACPTCRQNIDSAISGGSKIARSLRALVAGLGAAVAGFLAYWLIRVLTGYEFALVAIAIGFMVGAAVRWGAQNRGGIFYQLMAVALTYLSIASNYTPDVLQGMRQNQGGPTEETAPANIGTPLSEQTAAPNPPDSAATFDSAFANPSTTRLTNAAPVAIADNEPADPPLPTWFLLPFAFILSLAVPFMGGLNIIGWLIIFFGLLQAWSMNKRVPIQVAGPFDAGTAPPASPTLQT